MTPGIVLLTRVRSNPAAFLAMGRLLGAPGATTTVVLTQTVTRVRTVPAHVRTVVKVHTVTVGGSASSSASTGYASEYPSTFAAAFARSCLASGGTGSTCTCALTYIEGHEHYSTVLTAEPAIAKGEDPSWYAAAVSTCTTG